MDFRQRRILYGRQETIEKYKVNIAYKLMDQSNQQITNWPWKQIWKSRIRHKVSCFVWLLANKAALIQDNVMKRGITLCSRCFLCGETLETVNHLFLHCKYTQVLNDYGVSF